MNVLEQAGEYLYGPQWRSELARQLNVTYKTITRWFNGSNPIKCGHVQDILELVKAKAAQTDYLIKALESEIEELA